MMAYGCFATWRGILLAFFAVRIGAIPGVAFPFNSQVPTVARAGKAYNFEFSASTFVPSTSNFTYSLSDQPAWLLLDSETRKLSGTPSRADAGVTSFTLTAADTTGAAHMPCILVVSTDPAPQIDWSISDQLAATTNLSSSQPPVVTLLPSTPFKFDFRHDSFIDIVQRKLSFYATLTDHTPLPSWLTFDAESLHFAGIAPDLSAFPQSWDVELIASDVEGFAGATATFQLAVGTQQLVFVPEQQYVNITPGRELQFDELNNDLYLNGKTVDPKTMKSADATLPSWLTFDPDTFLMKGTVPTNANDLNITVTVTDQSGTRATAILNLIVGDSMSTVLFNEDVPSLTAYYGKTFDFHFPDTMFKSQSMKLMVELPESASWLHFDSTTRRLSGTVPTKTKQTTIEATIVAQSPGMDSRQSETFTIRLLEPLTISTTLTRSITHSTATATSTHLPLPAVVVRAYRLGPGAVAGIIVGTVIAIAIIAALLVCCWKRRRHAAGYVDSPGKDKRTISRPIVPSQAAAIAVTTDVQMDVEKHADAPMEIPARLIDPAPQIALDIPVQPANKKLKWSTRFSHISQASSIGNGEDAIRADANIPEWGMKSTARHTPHDSFSIPTEIARSSKLSNDHSPSKRATRNLRQSRQSAGLGIDMDADNDPQELSRKERNRRKDRDSLGQSTIHERASALSTSTRGTSLLSMRPSDFPRPPTRSTTAGGRSIPALAYAKANNRKSIRLVTRSNSTLDNRSIQEKRQSFIRNRASTTLASPLFAHGSRALSDARQNGHGSVNGSGGPSYRRNPRERSQLTSYSESSSVEPPPRGPPPRNPRRLSAKIRSAFASSYPRAVTKSTIGADDEDSDDWSTTSSTEERDGPAQLNRGDYERRRDSSVDFRAQLALPRDQRSFVLPGEASPTPPPSGPSSRQASGKRVLLPSARQADLRQRYKAAARTSSSSSLARVVAVSAVEQVSLSSTAAGEQKRRSRLSEPMSLVSTDSLSRGKVERPRLVQASSKRPVSVDKIERLSSLKAEADDAGAGSEMWELMDGAGLMPPGVGALSRDATQRSNMSGPAFL